MERLFPRTVDSLEAIFRFVDEFLEAEGLEASNAFDLNMIFEELFTNMVKYNTESDRDIRISIDREKDVLVLCVTDFDVEPFDITQARDVDVDRPGRERTPGGLGIHFVRQLVDSMTYDYADRTSRITLTKRLES
jgi:serine/threonine-protein kinase RsbW